MILSGYKAFNKDHTNRYGLLFETGKIYKTDGDLKYGNNGNGFHMAKNLSDVFRYFDSDNDNVSVAKVTGMGKYILNTDEYNGYDDLYVFQYLRVDRFLKREEIIALMLECNNIFLLQHFFQTFKLNEEEKVLFSRKCRNDEFLMNNLLYYQYGVNKYDVKGLKLKKGD